MSNSIFGNRDSGGAVNSAASLAALQQQYQDRMQGRMGRAATQANAPYYNTYRTVFNDISDEWNACSEEEKRFIEQDQEYNAANIQYAQQFNSFLIDNFGLQFTNSKYGTSAEKVLLAIKNARGRYQKESTDNLAKIKAENETLLKRLNELERKVGKGDKNNDR